MTGDDVYALPFPVTHIGGVAMVTAQLRSGFTSLLCSSFDPIATSRFLADNAVTILSSAAPFFHGYMAAQAAHGSERLFPRLRFSANGGAPMPPEVSRQVIERLGGSGVLSGWGLTECPMSTFASPADPEVAMLETNGVAGPGVDHPRRRPGDRRRLRARAGGRAAAEGTADVQRLPRRDPQR